MDLQTLKNTYAQEQGYEDWNDMRKLFREKLLTFVEMTTHENEICIRAQKAALENAAENAKFGYGIGGVGSSTQYIIDRTSITNEQNLIQ